MRYLAVGFLGNLFMVIKIRRLPIASTHQTGFSPLTKLANLPIVWHNGSMGVMVLIIDNAEI
jgi:hypothetical protein